MDNEICIVYMDKGVTVNPRHVEINLDNDQGSSLNRCFHDVNADAEAHITMVIRGGTLNQGDINGYTLAPEQIGNGREKYRAVICHPPVNGIPGIVPDKERVVPEIGLELLLGIEGNPEGPHVEHLGIKEGLGAGLHIVDEGTDKVLGLATSCPDKNPVTWMDITEYPVFRDKFSWI